MDNHIFRSAALGFNRQDVMEYIEKVQKDAESKAAWLNAELEAARRESGEARQALEDCIQERDRLGEELNALKEQYEQEKTAREDSAQESVRQSGRLQELETENRRLMEQVQALEGRTEDLRREKERLTQLELDARSRSDEVLAQAQTQAAGIVAQANAQAADVQAQAQAQAEAVRTQAQTQADTLLAETNRELTAAAEKCEGTLRSFESLAAHISGELRQLDATVNQLPAGLVHLKSALAELMGQEPEEEQ